MSSVSTSYRQKFANEALDACEHYFTGKRVPHKKDEEKWWITTLRVSSWFTVVVPLGFAATFVLAKALQRPDNSMKQYWEDRIHVHHYNSHDKKIFIDVLIRSGITQTSFEHIYLLSVPGGGGPGMPGHRMFAGDGHFSDAHKGNTFEEQKKILALKIFFHGSGACKCNTKKKTRYGWNNNNSNYVGGDPIYPSTPRMLQDIDYKIVRLFRKLPNQLKEILLADPDYLHDAEPKDSSKSEKVT